MGRPNNSKSSYAITQEVKRQRLNAGNLRLPEDAASQGLPAFTVKVAALGASANTEDPEQMYANFLKYLKFCEAYKVPVGNLGAYASMGISKEDASRYLSGARRAEDPRYKELIQIVKNTCATYREAMMATNKIAPATGIFWQKNFDNMKDVQDIVVAGNDPLGEKKDPAEIINKYTDLLSDDIEG